MLSITVTARQPSAAIPEKAKEYLDKVDELNEGKFLLAKFYRARYYGYPKQDVELYEKMLQEVIDAPDDIFPGEEAATALAKSRAKRWLGQTDTPSIQKCWKEGQNDDKEANKPCRTGFQPRLLV